MYLRRLEIAGFKSFATRVKFEFQPGISAVVGPNGSGKSNVAEAIRWVLGEQNSRGLRARKNEELIFSGSEGGKAKASMAEVIMVLEGKANETELGIDQLVISRRLYRSGESEYRLGGRRVLIKDLLKILAQAGFGTSSYTVIGQGMIDSLIIASPAERKLLFEEASGIRAFELERADTLRKLAKAQERVTILRAEIAELVPERDALAAQVDRLARREALESQLKEARQAFVSGELYLNDESVRQLRAELSQSQQALKSRYAELKKLEREAEVLASGSAKTTARQAELLEQLSVSDGQRNTLSEQIATLQAQLKLLEQMSEQQITRPSQLKAQLKQVNERLQDFQKRLKIQVESSEKYATIITEHNTTIGKFNRQLTRLRAKLRSNQRNSYLAQALGLARLLVKDLQSDKALDNEKVRIALYKLIRSVKLASESDLTAIPLEIAQLQQSIAREIARREDVVEQQTTEIIKVRSLELDINALEKERNEIEARLEENAASQQTQPQAGAEYRRELKQLTRERDRLDTLTSKLRDEIASLTASSTTDEQVALARRAEETRQSVSELEHKIQAGNTELESLTSQRAELVEQAKTWKVKPQASRPATKVEVATLTRMEAELDVIGEVDVALVGAHKELIDRVDFLEHQAGDMERAEADLRTVLAELERRIQTTFKQNFAKINLAFGKHFAELFRGGTAALELTEFEDDEYGIEITAKPPGKRVELLSSLSGGERALAAIALLAAILSVNPSPFVVLDEVDAALDDANAQLFTQTLKSLAKHSQLLIITHNHETMLEADALYGITTSPKTASTVISVDLKSAEVLVSV